MPKVEDIFSRLKGATYFTTLDLGAGYHHIPLDKPSIPKTAFNSPFRKFEYMKAPFGLAQAPAYFQELMTGYFKGFQLCNSLSRWHNNIQQNTPGTPFTHQNGLQKTQISKPFHGRRASAISCLQRNSVSKDTSSVLQASDPFLQRNMPYNICNHQLHPNKLEPFLAWSDIIESSSRDLQKLAKPLTLLTRQQVKFEWTPEHHTTFLHLKEAIVQAPILHYPNPDKRYIVYTGCFR